MSRRKVAALGVWVLSTWNAPHPGLAQDQGCDLNCTNGGNCVTGLAYEGSDSCLCPPGMSGMLCEIDEQEVESEFELPQQSANPLCETNLCQHGGVCRPSTGFSGEPIQVCECPPGYAGDLCEVDVEGEPCGEEPCQNGSKCLTRPNGVQHCMCNGINTKDSHFTGRYCQHEVFSFCSDTSEYYCANGGKCVDQGNE